MIGIDTSRRIGFGISLPLKVVEKEWKMKKIRKGLMQAITILMAFLIFFYTKASGAC